MIKNRYLLFTVYYSPFTLLFSILLLTSCAEVGVGDTSEPQGSGNPLPPLTGGGNGNDDTADDDDNTADDDDDDDDTTIPSNPAAVILGAAGDFVILAKAGIDTIPTSAITGNIGVTPIDSSGITGFSLIADAGK